MKGFFPLLAGLLGAWVSCVSAQATRSSDLPDLAGVYQSIPNGTILPGGLKNSGSPAEISLLPKAAAQAKTINPKDDPARTCQPVGPFRMTARDGMKMEIAPATGLVVMLFEDYLHGVMRIVYMNRGHKENVVDGPEPGMEPGPTWLGDSIGRWDGGTLVVDTVGFNTRTWLNDAGAQHSEALHLIERIRPVLGGQYLEYKMTAEDPNALAKPYTYTRYFKKLGQEIEDDICTDEP
jgi:hypothetical protein